MENIKEEAYMKNLLVAFLMVAFLAFFAGIATAGDDENLDSMHEPQGGAYIGTNKLTTWGGGWVKYKYSKKTCDSAAKGKCIANVGAVYPGVGVLGSFTTGRTKNSTYKYDEWAAGPLGGAKFFGEDDTGRPWMVEIDVAPQFYGVKGHNKEKERYYNDQKGIKANVRIEANKITGESSVIGGYIEGNIPIKVTSYKSSWKGDKPSNRGSIEIGGYKITPINDDWDYELSVSLMKGFWDRQVFGKIVPLELIYKNRLRFGGGVSLPLGISSVYKGASFGDLVTPWAFVQYDTGPDVRKIDAGKKSSRVIPLDKPANKENKTNAAKEQRK